MTEDITYNIIQKMHESEEAFILDTALPYCEQIEHKVIKKEELKKALQRQRTYRWHDLRENPNDLPSDYKRALICLKGFESNPSGILIAIHSKLSKKWETETSAYDDDDVIAWREIETFEELEE